MEYYWIAAMDVFFAYPAECLGSHLKSAAKIFKIKSSVHSMLVKFVAGRYETKWYYICIGSIELHFVMKSKVSEQKPSDVNQWKKSSPRKRIGSICPLQKSLYLSGLISKETMNSCLEKDLFFNVFLPS